MTGELRSLMADQPCGLVDSLEALAGELLKWNRTHNLTGQSDERGVVVDLFLDGLAMAPHLRGASLLDIGSGAGFPGLVLALACPEITVTSLEPRAKRISFQKQAARLLNLADRFVPVMGRTGDPALAGKVFDTVTLRAVGSLADSLAMARPYLAALGRVVLPRGLADRGEARALGLTVIDYELPPPGGPRILVIQG